MKVTNQVWAKTLLTKSGENVEGTWKEIQNFAPLPGIGSPEEYYQRVKAYAGDVYGILDDSPGILDDLPGIITDLEQLQRIHRLLFFNLFPWAGELNDSRHFTEQELGLLARLLKSKRKNSSHL
jgi:hypothetical protein